MDAFVAPRFVVFSNTQSIKLNPQEQSPYPAREKLPKLCFQKPHSVLLSGPVSLLGACAMQAFRCQLGGWEAPSARARAARSAADAYPCCMLPQIAAFVFYTVRVFYSLEELDFLNNILPFL